MKTKTGYLRFLHLPSINKARSSVDIQTLFMIFGLDLLDIDQFSSIHLDLQIIASQDELSGLIANGFEGITFRVSIFQVVSLLFLI
jgi:hypothetical protein